MLLHALLLTKSGSFFADTSTAPGRNLRVTLVASPKPAAAMSEPQSFSDRRVVSEALPVSEAQAKPLTREPVVASPVIQKRIPSPKPEPPAPRAAPPAAAAAPASPPAAPARPEPTPAAPSAAEVATAKSGQKAGIPLGLSDQLSWVNIEFETFLGADRQSAGLGWHRYSSDESGRYAVSVKAAAKEGGALDDPSWRLEIAGNIRKSGLFPTLFRMKGVLPERFLSLVESPEVGAGAPATLREGRLPDSILDRQSLLYSFMLKPPNLTGGSVMLSDGTRYTTFSYSLAGIESFSVVPFGTVRAVKLVFSSPDSAEIIELWLLSDIHYLPVKMRHVDRRGVITEQLVSSLDFK